MSIGVGIIGAGTIGRRRAQIARASSISKVVRVADVDANRAQALADDVGAASSTDWREVVADSDVDAVVVAVFNKYLSPISVAALQAGKHVLCEKPPGRNAAEAAAMAEAAQRTGCQLKLGFNLRFHPAIRAGREAVASGQIGDLLFIRAVYGHGGRPGYSDEWRGDIDLAGGGELLDQGVHLLDLTRWFLGELKEVAAITPQWVWRAGQVEDNAFVILRTDGGKVASLHSSWTQWRNRFSFEAFGVTGFVRIEGLGGSYGTESLTVGIRRLEAGPPHESSKRFDAEDTSWRKDWSDFERVIVDGGTPEVSGQDGVAIMSLVDRLYALASVSDQPDTAVRR